jgi:hypothetical protein
MKTGLSFRHIGGIETRDRSIADAVLPIAVEWLQTAIDQGHYRHALYALFHTPWAAKYIRQILNWWEHEEYELASDCLAQTAALLVSQPFAERVWEIAHRVPRRACHYLVLAKLSSLEPVARKAKEEIFNALRGHELEIGDLTRISSVPDPRIRAWFEQHVDSKSPHIRNVARRVVKRKTRLPAGLRYVDSEPDRAREIYSTEVDLAELGEVLKNLKVRWSVKIPRALASGVAELDLDRWAVVDSLAANKPAEVWVRLEDVDTVEIVLIRGEAIAPAPAVAH